MYRAVKSYTFLRKKARPLLSSWSYNQFKRNFAKLWQRNKQATTEDRRGEVRFRLYAIYRTLGVSTAGSNLGHRSGVTEGISTYPFWDWQKRAGEIPPRWLFLIGTRDRFLPPQHLKSQKAGGQGWYNLIIVNPNLRWEWPVWET